jgi:hypothetical protein
MSFVINWHLIPRISGKKIDVTGSLWIFVAWHCQPGIHPVSGCRKQSMLDKSRLTSTGKANRQWPLPREVPDFQSGRNRLNCWGSGMNLLPKITGFNLPKFYYSSQFTNKRWLPILTIDLELGRTNDKFLQNNATNLPSFENNFPGHPVPEKILFLVVQTSTGWSLHYCTGN